MIPESTSQHTPHPLSLEHERILTGGSGISRDVLDECGAWSIAHGRELPKGFSRRQRQRGAGILFALHRPNGETSWSFRPDAVDPESPGRKYEQPCRAYGGPGNVLYVHPSQRHLIADSCVPVVFVEGIKKALAIVSAAKTAGVEVLVVAILGVWNWLSDGEPIADVLGIPVDGREVHICFDSDVFRNPDVADAARRLATHLIERGATVRLAFLPDQPDGSKTGADDYLAGGRTYGELVALIRDYDPADLAAERLKRGDRLQATLENLRRRFWETEFKGMGGHSSRDVIKVLEDLVPDRGKLHADGLRVKISRRELARLAKVSSRTLQKAIERLEEMELLYRDTDRQKAEAAGAFVLVAKPRASVKQYGDGHPATGDTDTPLSLSHRGVLHLLAPRLRWSSPARKGRRGVVKGTRRVRLSLATNSRPAVKRLGKIRGAVLDALDAAGGSATVGEICEVLHRKRPRDLKGRVLPMLERARIIAVDGETVTLAPDWLERLEEARELGDEVEAERREHDRHKRESEAFRRRLELVPDPAPTEEEMRAQRESYPERRRQHIAAAMARLFEERPEYRSRRTGQITCALIRYIGPDFPRGPDGAPKDAEVEELLAGAAA